MKRVTLDTLEENKRISWNYKTKLTYNDSSLPFMAGTLAFTKLPFCIENDKKLLINEVNSEHHSRPFRYGEDTVPECQFEYGVLEVGEGITVHTDKNFLVDFDNKVYTDSYCFKDMELPVINNVLNINDSDSDNVGVFVVGAGAGSLFQHFLQDVLPLIMGAYQFLKQNPNIPIICSNCPFAVHCINNLLGLTNQVRPINNWITSKKMFVPWITPFYRGEYLPFPLLEKASIQMSIINKPKYLILISRRNCVSRHVSNEINVFKMVFKESKKRGLEPFLYIPSKYTEETRQIFSQAGGIIAPHGGGNYNILFTPHRQKKVFFIEVLTKNDLHTCWGTALAAGMDYYPLIGEGHHSKRDLLAPLDNIQTVFDSIPI